MSKWLSSERIGRAQQLLETTDMSIEQVAADSGFGTSLSLRQHFANELRTSPSSYRRTFRDSTAQARAATGTWIADPSGSSNPLVK